MKGPALTTFLREPPSESTSWFFGKKDKSTDYIVTTCKADDDFLEQTPEVVVSKHAPDVEDGSSPSGSTNNTTGTANDQKRSIKLPLDKERRRKSQRSKMKEWWVADKMAKQCYECRMGFGVLVRKHHCRVCGQIFCSKCSSNFIPGDRIGFSDESEVRLCICCNLVWQEYDKNQTRQQHNNVSSLSSKAQGIARQASMLANTRGRTSSDVSVRTRLLQQTKNLIPPMGATPQRRNDQLQWLPISESPRQKQNAGIIPKEGFMNWEINSNDLDNGSMAGTNAATASEIIATMPTEGESILNISVEDATNSYLTSEPPLQLPGSAWRAAASQLTEEKIKQLNKSSTNGKNRKTQRECYSDSKGHIINVRNISEKPRLDDSYYDACDEETESLSSISHSDTDSSETGKSDTSRQTKPDRFMNDRNAWKSLQSAAHVHLKNLIVKLLANLVESATDPVGGQQPQDSDVVSLFSIIQPIISRALWAKTATPAKAPQVNLHSGGVASKPPPLFKDSTPTHNATVVTYKSAPEDCTSYAETAAALVAGALIGEDSVNKNDLSVAVVAAVRSRVDNNPSSLVDTVLGHELVQKSTSTRYKFLRKFEREFSNVFYNPPSTPIFDLPRIQEAQLWISKTYSLTLAIAAEILQLLHRRYSIFPADSESTGFDPHTIKVNITEDGTLPFRVTVLPVINSAASYSSVNHLPPLIKLMGSKEEVFSFRRKFKQQFNEPRYRRSTAISWIQKEYKVEANEAEAALHYIETSQMSVGLSKLFGDNLEGFRRHFSTQFSQIRYVKSKALSWIMGEFECLRHDADCALQYIEETEGTNTDLSKVFGTQSRLHVKNFIDSYCGILTIPQAIAHIQKAYGTSIQVADSTLRYIRNQLFNPDLRNKFLMEFKNTNTARHSDITAWSSSSMHLSTEEDDVVGLLEKMNAITKVDGPSGEGTSQLYDIHPSLGDIPSVSEAERALIQNFDIVAQKPLIVSWLKGTYATTHADDLFSLLEHYKVLVKKDDHRFKINQFTATSPTPLVGTLGIQIPASNLYSNIKSNFANDEIDSDVVVRWVSEQNHVTIEESREICDQLKEISPSLLRALSVTGSVELAEVAIESLFVNCEVCQESEIVSWIKQKYHCNDDTTSDVFNFFIENKIIILTKDGYNLVNYPKIISILRDTNLVNGWHPKEDILSTISSIEVAIKTELDSDQIFDILLTRSTITQLSDESFAYEVRSTKNSKQLHEMKHKGEQLLKLSSDLKSFRRRNDAHEKIDIPTWCKVISRLSWKIAKTVFPCVWKDRDDLMDIRGYIKVLTEDGGTPWDSEFIKGLVIPGNVCKRKMPQNVKNPRILLVGDHIDFEPTTVVTDISSLQGAQQQYNSVGQLINSGSWLEQLGNRVEVMRPDVVLVERSVNLKVQESLSNAGIALATAISKKSLNRIHRMTQATIVKDLARIPTHYLQDAADDIGDDGHRKDSGAPRLGQVSLFEVRPIKNKPHMYICGGDTEKGCTVVLRGLSKALLKKLKDVIRNAALFAHNLVLEIHYLCDSYCCIPNGKLYNSAPSVPFNGVSPRNSLSVEAQEFFNPTNNYDAIRSSTELLSASLCVDFQLPDLLNPKKNTEVFLETDPAVRRSKLLEVCRDVGYLNPLCHQSIMVQHTITKHASGGSGGAQVTPPALSAMLDGENVQQTFTARGRAMSTTNIPQDVEGISTKVQQQLNVSAKDLASQAHQFGHLHSGQCADNDTNEAPQANQTVGADARDAAMRPPESTLQMPGDAAREFKKLVLEYYKISRNKGSDTPLIFYLAEYFSLASTPGSGLPVRQYSHNKGRLTVIAEQVPDEEFSSDLVLMWSYCKKCESAASPRVECSRHTLSYSFGKFLETSFYNSNVVSRRCGHSLHRDMVRCFGQSVYLPSGKNVNVQVKFDYSPVEIYTLEFPELEIKYDTTVFNNFIDSEYRDLIESITQGYTAVREGLDELESQIPIYQDEVSVLRTRMSKESLAIAEVANKLRFGSSLSALTVMELNSMRKSLHSSLMGWRRTLQEKHTTFMQIPLSGSTSTSQGVIPTTATDASMNASGGFSPDANTSSATLLSLSASQPQLTNQKKKPWMRLIRKDGHDRSATLSNDLPFEALDSPTNVNSGTTQGFLSSPMAPHASGTLTPPQESPFILENEVLTYSQSTFGRIHSPQNSLDFDKLQHSGSIPVGRKVSQPHQSSGSLPLNSKSSGKLSTPMLNSIGNTSKNSLLNLAAGVDGLTVIVRLDEPTSVISYTLCSDQYKKACQPPTPPGSTRMPRASQSGFAAPVLGGGYSPPPSPKPQPISRSTTVDYSTDGERPQSPLNSLLASADFSIASPAVHPNDLMATSSRSIDFGTSTSSIPRKESTPIKPLPLGRIHSTSGSGSIESLLEVLGEKMRRVEIKEFEEIHPTDATKTKQQPHLRFACTVLCARQFAALRQYYCDGDESTFIASLSRCIPFSPTGGRTGASYYKTRDGRFVLKAIKQEEVTYFEQTMSKRYFQYVARAIKKKMPSLLIKILGVFKIQVPKTEGHAPNSWLLMENLFYNRKVDRMFDLKGSRRNRFQADQTAVLLDENLLLLLRDGDWLFTKEDSKERLAVGVHNDTLMLKRNQIMDYSMLLGLDDTKKEIYMGIIDYMREYDLKKQVEWVVKSSGIMGGRGQQPTVVDPTKYKERFRAAMNNYFLMLPNKATPWIIKYKKYQMLVDPGSELNFELH